jgi:hypothetical protein
MLKRYCTFYVLLTSPTNQMLLLYLVILCFKRIILQECERLVITTDKLKVECCGNFSSEMCESKQRSVNKFSFQILDYTRGMLKEVSCLKVNQQK